MKSKLHFGDRVAVLNVFLYQTGGSRFLGGKRCMVRLGKVTSYTTHIIRRPTRPQS
jgi:hypothetical protein